MSEKPVTTPANALNLPKITCKKDGCDSTLFTQAYELHLIPAVYAQSGRQEIGVIPVFFCAKCKTRLEFK